METASSVRILQPRKMEAEDCMQSESFIRLGVLTRPRGRADLLTGSQNPYELRKLLLKVRGVA